MAKYAPNIALIKLELKSEFQRSKLWDASQDPDVWMSELESIRARLKEVNSDITDEDFIVHVLNGLPPEYEVQVSKLEECFGSTSNLLTIQDMRNKLNLKYARLKRQTAEQAETDQALVAFRRFKGKCTNCGKFGHKSTECRLKVKNSKQEGSDSEGDKLKKATNKSKVKCFSCGEMGHYRSKCPKNKSKKETAKQSENKAETVLMTIDGEERPHEDIWIADSAASTHIVNSKVGLFDVKNVREPVKIGDGKLVYAKKVGWLKVSYTNYT